MVGRGGCSILRLLNLKAFPKSQLSCPQIKNWTFEGMDAELVVQIALGLAQTMEAAHTVGFVHLDLKPDNILLDNTLRPIVIDWGIAIRNVVTGLTDYNIGTDR